MTPREVKALHSYEHGGHRGRRTCHSLYLVPHRRHDPTPTSGLVYPQGILPGHLNTPWIWGNPHRSKSKLRMAQGNTSITISRTPPNPHTATRALYPETLWLDSFHSNHLSSKGLRGEYRDTPAAFFITQVLEDVVNEVPSAASNQPGSIQNKKHLCA